jgi:hypothetical protein
MATSMENAVGTVLGIQYSNTEGGNNNNTGAGLRTPKRTRTPANGEQKMMIQRNSSF